MTNIYEGEFITLTKEQSDRIIGVLSVKPYNEVNNAMKELESGKLSIKMAEAICGYLQTNDSVKSFIEIKNHVFITTNKIKAKLKAKKPVESKPLPSKVKLENNVSNDATTDDTTTETPEPKQE